MVRIICDTRVQNHILRRTSHWRNKNLLSSVTLTPNKYLLVQVAFLKLAEFLRQF